MKNILIIGYGQLGQTVCQAHLDSGNRLFTVCRSTYSELSVNHDHTSCDLDTLNSRLQLPSNIDCLYYFAPPSDTDLTDKRLANFLSTQNHLSIKHLIYISTSGVYGDSNGTWITEETKTNPGADRAKRRLDAEKQLINFSDSNQTKVTILRCAAIYSAKTINVARIKANIKPVITASSAPYTNRIHIKDLTEVCMQAMLHPPEKFEVYNVSDGQPSTTTEHAWLLADLAGVKRSSEIELSEADQYYSSAYLSYLNESKRLDISKLKQQLKPNFRFKNIEAGIKDCLNSD